MNFTIEVDPEVYREASGEELSKEDIRQAIQQAAIRGLLDRVDARLLGRNNVYDPKKRVTGRV